MCIKGNRCRVTSFGVGILFMPFTFYWDSPIVLFLLNSASPVSLSLSLTSFSKPIKLSFFSQSNLSLHSNIRTHTFVRTTICSTPTLVHQTIMQTYKIFCCRKEVNQCWWCFVIVACQCLHNQRVHVCRLNNIINAQITSVRGQSQYHQQCLGAWVTRGRGSCRSSWRTEQMSTAWPWVTNLAESWSRGARTRKWICGRWGNQTVSWVYQVNIEA